MKRHLLIFRLLAGLVVLIMVFVSDFSIAMAYEKEIKTISLSIAESVTVAGKKTVAVVDFTDLQGNVTELGRFLAEEISVDMTIAAKGFEVIDRTHLNSVMKEHELSMLGITDPKKIKKLGEVAGVDAIVTGSVTPFGDSVRITCKVIATDTARTIGASKGDIAKTKAIEELLARGIESGTLPEQATSQQSNQRSTEIKKEKLFFKNDLIEITVKSLSRIGKNIELILLYKNITDKNIGLSLAGYHGAPNRYLIDENGERAEFVAVENLGNWYTYVTNIPPKLPVVVKIKFTTKADSVGNVFTAVLDHIFREDPNESPYQKRGSEFQAVIRDIKTMK